MRAALLDDATSIDDQTATSHLPPSPNLAFRTHDSQGAVIISAGNATINQLLNLTSANAKALRSAMLGFITGLTAVDKTSLPAGPSSPLDISEQPVLTSWDLFRFSAESLPLLDLTPGGRPYFSIDGGATQLARLASGEFNGDGHHPVHWPQGHGLMDLVTADFADWTVSVRYGTGNGQLSESQLSLCRPGTGRRGGSRPGWATKLPAWFKRHDWKMPIKHTATSVLPKELGLVDHAEKTFHVQMSGPERAMVECLHLVPTEFDLVECFQLMQGLGNLRPQVVAELLTVCTSVKAKRLFLYLAEKAEHQWLTFVDQSSVDLGKGERSLCKGGVYVPKYHLVVPQALAAS